MHIDVKTPITDLAGKPIRDGDHTATLQTIIVNALLTPTGDPSKQPTGVEKLKVADLADRIFNSSGKVEITVEEAALIKSKVDAAYPHPLIYARVVRAIEQQPAQVIKGGKAS